MDQIIRN